MFTGIIEEVGKITGISSSSGITRLSITCKIVLEGMKTGDSIAVDGVCLTVVSFNEQSFEVEVMKETIDKTTLSQVKLNRSVNLERALSAQGRLNGHFVTGHIDGIGIIKKINPQEGQAEMIIEFPGELSPWLIPKGSVTVDGISLTVGKLQKEVFTVYLIPHTLNETAIGEKTAGGRVNLETDIIGKYILRYMTMKETDKTPAGKISANFLKEHGII